MSGFTFAEFWGQNSRKDSNERTEKEPNELKGLDDDFGNPMHDVGIVTSRNQESTMI
jgi:hypothetical protein